ncbi:MAG: Unknown protein [uncultured Aureispira sp.]|uniref:Uncharacterized protein n=1 Tax=uncultured Aureispira sp. TaxID=1331704 RepID=A0A6S6S8V6_9BACT|nr:MAG: Unknown protein [uncultured Aureispira sp.]
MFSVDYVLIVEAMCLLVDILFGNEIDSHKKILILVKNHSYRKVIGFLLIIENLFTIKVQE